MTKQIKKKLKEFMKDCESSVYGQEADCTEIKKYFTKAFQAIRKEATKDLLKQMLKECDKTENEAGRLLVKKFMR